jgi:hypothetical protein
MRSRACCEPVVVRTSSAVQSIPRVFDSAGLSETLFSKLDDLSTWSRYSLMNYAELMAWSIIRRSGLSYPENCLLGVYQRRDH